MPSNYTPNYQLNQWNADDRVLRTDFNADNEKIDTALAGKIGRPELLWEYEQTEGSTRQINIDLTDIDWGHWTMVAVLLSPQWIGFGSNDSVTVSLSVGLVEFGAPGAGKMGPRCAVFFPNHNRDNLVRMLTFPGGTMSESTDTFASLKYLHFDYSGQDSLRSGTKVRIYGLR